jgi:hypothetical protein
MTWSKYEVDVEMWNVQLPSSLSLRLPDEKPLEVCGPALIKPEMTPGSTSDTVSEPGLIVSTSHERRRGLT